MNRLFTMSNQPVEISTTVAYDPLEPEAGWTLTYVIKSKNGTVLLAGSLSGIETDELVRRIVSRLLELFQWDSRLDTFRGQLKDVQRAYRAELELAYAQDPYVTRT